MCFLTLDLKTKLITFKSTLMKSLYGMTVYKVLRSKVEIELAFFLTLILFSLVTIGKEFCTIQNFYSLNKKAFVMKTLYSIKNHFENFESCIREWLSASFLGTTINLAPMGVLSILANQYKVESVLSSL